MYCCGKGDCVMKATIKFKKEHFLGKVLEYLCIGLVGTLYIIWGIVLTVIYLLVLLITNGLRLFRLDR